jgi:hypothetical protein
VKVAVCSETGLGRLSVWGTPASSAAACRSLMTTFGGWKCNEANIDPCPTASLVRSEPGIVTNGWVSTES